MLFSKSRKATGSIFPEPCRQIPDSAKDTDGRNDTLSLRKETEKGALIDSQRLSIPLRGRCGMYAAFLWAGEISCEDS